MDNLIKFDNARELRDFLNGHTTKELEDIYLRSHPNIDPGDDITGLRIVTNVLSDNSQTTDYVFV